MQSADITTYATNLTALMNTAATQPNIASIQSQITTIEANIQTVLNEQSNSAITSTTDIQDYTLSLIRNPSYNKSLFFATLSQCYFDYDNQIRNTSDPVAQQALIASKQAFKDTLMGTIQSDPFGTYMLALIKFING